LLASDLNNTEFANPQNPDSLLNVQFYVKALANEFKTALEGRPVFDDVVMVRIIPPGDGLNIIDTPAREDHKRRFPRHWEFFERMHGKDNLQSGTPLEQWPQLGPSQVAQLKAMQFHSVEQIAGASDEQITRMGMAGGMSPFALRDKAIRYLQVAKDSSTVDHAKEEAEALRKQMADSEARHAEELRQMREQIAALAAAQQMPIQRLPDAPKRRGRPPKVKPEEAAQAG
jgi:hypothetical protein